MKYLILFLLCHCTIVGSETETELQEEIATINTGNSRASKNPPVVAPNQNEPGLESKAIKQESDWQKENSFKDLAAQESMAGSTKNLVSLTGAGVLISSIGLVLLLWTINQNRKAFQHIKNTSFSELKPYLSLSDHIRVDRSKEPASIILDINFENGGKTPATNMQFEIAGEDLVIQEISEHLISGATFTKSFPLLAERNRGSVSFTFHPYPELPEPHGQLYFKLSKLLIRYKDLTCTNSEHIVAHCVFQDWPPNGSDCRVVHYQKVRDKSSNSYSFYLEGKTT